MEAFMKKKMVVTLSAMFLLLTVSFPAHAEEQDFTLVNATGGTIDELFVSPVAAEDWQEDVLGVEELEDGEEVQITFSRDEEACAWDLMIKDDEGTEINWGNIDLCKYTRITLHSVVGKAWATFE
jgi:hypothetical protein